MEKFLLKFLDLFSWAYKLIPVDYAQLRAIVEIKLITDNRRQHIAYRKNQKEPGNAFIMTLFFYSIFGVFVALALYTIPSFILSMIVFFSYLMVMVAMTMITDFSSILLDTSDNTVILPRPVDGRTLFVARVTHILLYVGQLTIGLCLVPAIAVFIKYDGVLLLGFLTASVLSVIMAVLITNGLYLLILQFASEEKLKNIINYFQIGMAVSIMGGYQLLPRIIERLDMDTFVFRISWWNFLMPPVWMAGAMETIYSGLTDAPHIALTVCAVLLPPAGAFLVNRYLTPLFHQKLGTLGSGEGRTEKNITNESPVINSISDWITFSPIERGSFDLIFRMLGRDRKIRLKIYPTFGYIVVFGLIFTMRGKDDLATTWSELPGTSYHLMLLYLAFMVLQVALYEIPYSDDFKASWIYFSAPVEKPGELLSGMLKAIFIRLFLPGYLVIGIVILFIWGIHVVDDILFGLFNNVLMLILLALINKKHLPFSMAPSVRNQAGNLMRSILSVVIIGVLGGIHYLLTQQPFLLFFAIPIQLVAIYFLSKVYSRTAWSRITL